MWRRRSCRRVLVAWNACDREGFPGLPRPSLLSGRFFGRAQCTSGLWLLKLPKTILVADKAVPGALVSTLWSNTLGPSRRLLRAYIPLMASSARPSRHAIMDLSGSRKPDRSG